MKYNSNGFVGTIVTFWLSVRLDNRERVTDKQSEAFGHKQQCGWKQTTTEAGGIRYVLPVCLNNIS